MSQNHSAFSWAIHSIKSFLRNPESGVRKRRATTYIYLYFIARDMVWYVSASISVVLTLLRNPTMLRPAEIFTAKSDHLTV